MKTRGFTLFELLLVIVITGILAVIVAPVIREPMQAYFDQGGRAALVDAAEMAMRRMERDVRRALPYSIRVNATQDAVELVRVRDVARYREHGGPQNRRLRFNNDDDAFNVLGTFPSITSPYTLGTDHADERLVIFNLGGAPFDIYNPNTGPDPSNVAVPAATTVMITADGNEHRVTMTPSHQFQASSPSHRAYIAETAVSYACHNDGLYRRSGYGYLSAQPGTAFVADTGAGGALMTDRVTDCTFTEHRGSATQPGLLMMTLTLTNAAGESVTLQHMIHVPNAI